MGSSRSIWTRGRLGKALCLVTVLAILFGVLTTLTTRVGPAFAASDSDCSVRTFVDSQGLEVTQVVVAGKPPKTKMAAVEAPQADIESGVNTLAEVPAFDWSYGCSATAAAMIFGYYDRTGYANMYTGPTDGGVCPLDNSVWGQTSYPSVLCHECPLSASNEGVDGQTENGHVDDYWIDFLNSGPDPYIINGWTEHTSAGCTGDFMGTNQSKYGNKDGSTAFFFMPNGDPLYDYTGAEPNARDGCHGMRLFAESRGYTVITNFSQVIQGQATDPNKGFTFADYMAEIDAGRPVIIHVVGHTMLGFGYDTEGSIVYLRDTWDYSTHQMTWGGTYGGKQHKSVTVIHLAVSADTTPPAVTTDDATEVAGTSATLNGNLTSLGTAGSVTVSFVWGTASGSYPNETTGVARTETGPYYFDLDELTPGATYYYKAKAVGNGTSYGVEKSFSMGTVSPSVSTADASGVASTSATLNGGLTAMGSASSVSVSFEYGTGPGDYTGETKPESKTAAGSFSYSLDGLTPGQTYYFRAKAVGDGTVYGTEKSFTTGTTPPAVSTNDASAVTTSAARLNGNLTSLGTASSVIVSFVWGTASGSYLYETTGAAEIATGTYNYDLGSLAPGTTYYYKAKAVGDGTAYGTERIFTTGTTPPSVSTSDATNVATTSARLNGSLTSLGTASSVSVSFVWGTSSGSYPNETSGAVKTSTGTCYYNLGSLTPGTTYYYKAKASGHGTTYGVEKSFATGTTPPSVSTNDATNVATTSARLNGNLTSLGTASSVAVSFVWGTSSGSYPNETTAVTKVATGTYYSDLGGLTAGTTYYYKAKAVGHGTVYGTEKSFTTGTMPPSVSTNDASNITTNSARLNGNLTSLGTASSVTVSFVWGTTSGSYPNETTGVVKTAAGTYSFDLSGLVPGATYYYRAKAVGHGTVYGTAKSFTTGTMPPLVSTGDAANVGTETASVNGNLTSLGTASSVTVSFVWGTSSGTYPNETTGVVKTVAGTYSFDLSGLVPGATYYYKARAEGQGTSYGAENTFTTTGAATPPSVVTDEATGVTTGAARLNGNLTALGTASSVTVSFVWGTASCTYTNETAGQAMSSAGVYFFDLDGLTPGTTYYYKARAVGYGTVYGVEKTFTTEIAPPATQPPSVITGDASKVKSTSVTLGGSLLSVGSASTIYVSFGYGTSPGDYSSETSAKVMTAAGPFSINLRGLAAGTTYYFRAKAVGDGTVYGEEQSFTTASVVNARVLRKLASLETAESMAVPVDVEPLSPIGDDGGDEGAVSTAGPTDEMSFGWLAVSGGAAAAFLGVVVYLIWSLGHGR